jgi:hypothetical protein
VETKLNSTTQPSQASRWFSKTWEFSSTVQSQIDENFSSSYQPGGTLTAVVDRWTSRIQGKGQDPFGLGRWSYVSLWGKQDQVVTIISAYRVPLKSPSSVGVKTAYMQQLRAIQLKALEQTDKILIPEPNKQFILDLQSWIQHLQSRGHKIILCLDNNEDIFSSVGAVHPLEYNPNYITINSAHDGSLRTLSVTCGLVDVLADQHSSRPLPATYIRGKKCIDYILVSASIQHAVERSGILPYHSIFSGDHRPCFLDFNATALFSSLTSPLAPPCQRSLQLSDPRKILAYREALHEQLKYHKVFD